jgi:hypothetical protein
MKEFLLVAPRAVRKTTPARNTRQEESADPGNADEFLEPWRIEVQIHHAL